MCVLVHVNLYSYTKINNYIICHFVTYGHILFDSLWLYGILGIHECQHACAMYIITVLV